MVITTHDMEVKQLIESSRSIMSGYDHAVDIGLFSAVVKADAHQENITNKYGNDKLKDLKKDLCVLETRSSLNSVPSWI